LRRRGHVPVLERIHTGDAHREYRSWRGAGDRGLQADEREWLEAQRLERTNGVCLLPGEQDARVSDPEQPARRLGRQSGDPLQEWKPRPESLPVPTGNSEPERDGHARVAVDRPRAPSDVGCPVTIFMMLRSVAMAASLDGHATAAAAC